MATKTRRNLESRAQEGAKAGAQAAGNGPLRWSTERRLAFIEERLFWLGEVNRTDLVERFGVSMSQASVDIARYLALDPPDVDYDRSAKRYIAGERFKPVLAKPDASRFLGELRLVEYGILSVDDTMFGAVPAFDATPIPERPVDPFVLRAVLRAIRGRRALEVYYQSMSRTEPMRRTIGPDAVGHDGVRWRPRAFDHESREFRDFVLGRLTKPKVSDAARSTPEGDVDWQTSVKLVIAPHPKLTPAQSRA